MKIALLSDFHLGFGKGTERFEESFENAKSALELAISQKPDCILLLGDIFDSEIPDQETWHNAFKVFLPIKQTKGSCSIKRVKDGKQEKIPCIHIPVIAIHGTHEYRGKNYRNAVEVLESADFLVHLHAATAVVERGGEKIAVHGLSGVPEKHALAVLKLWNPKPVQGAVNVLLLHQSIKEFLPFDDEMIASISLADLPKGFDLIANGHLHWNDLQETGAGKFLLTGSTIITQMKKLEAEKPKCIELFDTETKKICFLELPGQRKMFYNKIKFEKANQDAIEKELSKRIELILANTFEKKPLVRFKLAGSLAKGISNSDVSLAEFEKKFSEKAILSISKNFDSESFKTRLAELRSAQQEKKSLSEMSLELLEKHLDETEFGKNFSIHDLLELFESGENDKALELILLASQKRKI
ncbi:MAG: DNA repair exonuclease [Candidatus Diapherotrites archaeon]|nr:DNA repair exonuclease [Candidatus Diapherotrites archaeon]